jgi:hypothetical protein
MTALEIVCAANADGVRLTIRKDGIGVQGHKPEAQRWFEEVAARRADVAAVLQEWHATSATDAILGMQCLLRERRK